MGNGHFFRLRTFPRMDFTNNAKNNVYKDTQTCIVACILSLLLLFNAIEPIIVYLKYANKAYYAVSGKKLVLRE